MRIAVIGGGPGGLYFAALAKQLGPDHEITVWERNAADDTFGFGVVFSDETLGGIAHADPVIHEQMEREFARWDDIDVHYRGEVVTSGGHGFAALGRKRLLEILQQRCAELGVDVHFRSTAPDVEQLCADHDLVVAADGVNSLVRTKYADQFRPTLDVRRCRYMWLGTDKVFEAFTFDILETPHGVMQLHGYPFDAHGSTFIVEMHDDVWRRAGFDRAPAQDLAPGESDEASWPLSASSSPRPRRSRGPGQQLALGQLHHGPQRALVARQRRAARRRGPHRPLLDRLRHQAGHGGRARPRRLPARVGRPRGRAGGYEEERKAVVVSTQRAAQASLEWFENLGQYPHQHPLQFAFNLLTRSRRITYDNLRLRDPEFIARVDDWFATTQLEAGHGTGDLPADVRAVPARAARAGQPGRRLTHGHVRRGGRPARRLPPRPSRRQALGGAGLVMTEMVCVSPEGRITPGCTGLWTDEQAAAWRRVTDFVHASSAARIGVQLGHSGPKGSTKLMWEGMDQPLHDGQLAGRRGLRPALPGRRQPDARVAGPRRHGRRRGRLRGRRRAGRRGGVRPPGAPLRPRLPAVLVPLPGDQPPRR